MADVKQRPALPPWRQLEGAVGTALTNVRDFLAKLLEQDQVWGNHVDVVFTEAGKPTRIPTGLGGVPRAFVVVRRDGDIRVWDATPNTPSSERGILWLQSNAPGKVTLYVY